MRALALGLLALVLAPCAPGWAAQPLAAVTAADAFPQVREIRFKPGASGAQVTDAAERGAFHVYSFVARKGQWTDIRVTAVESNAALTVWRPGVVLPQNRQDDIQGVALPGTAEGSDATRWRGHLPDSGRYVVTVGPTRGGAHYTLHVTIGVRPPAAASPSAPALPPK